MFVSISSFSQELTDLVERTSLSVIAVHARWRFHSSGIHWAPGVIVTAQHALRVDDGITITRGTDKYEGEVVGGDTGVDIAVLRIKGEHNLPVAARSEILPRPGALIATVGRNHESPNVGLGVVSSVGDGTVTRLGGRLDSVVRLDLSLHPASSGGAVVDTSGGLIGMATSALSRVAVFCVPNATIDRIVKATLERGGLRRGYLGAGLQPVALPQHLRDKLGVRQARGLMAISVDSEASAGKAGMLIGDILLTWDGVELVRTEILQSLLSDAVGKAVEFSIVRGGELVKVPVVVTERKASRP
jgi:S1-C subfamily serine protease